MSGIKIFSLKKSYLVGLATWLMKQPLNGKRSRERTKFVNILKDAIANLEKERLEILEKYVEKEIGEDKNETWKIKTVDNFTEYVILEDTRKDFDAEIVELYGEDFVFSILPEHKEKMAYMKDIVLETDYVFGVSENIPDFMKAEKMAETVDYDMWCEAFERI